MENTASSIVACWTVFTELLPGNARSISLQYLIVQSSWYRQLKYESRPEICAYEDVYNMMKQITPIVLVRKLCHSLITAFVIAIQTRTFLNYSILPYLWQLTQLDM
jgi:hypothetical protein